jgi:hypothetical protein
MQLARMAGYTMAVHATTTQKSKMLLLLNFEDYVFSFLTFKSFLTCAVCQANASVLKK